MKKTLIGLASFAGVLCVSADPISPAGTAAGNVAAIQAAIDTAAVANPAGTVTLGNGLFEIDAQLMVTGGVTLVGQGWDNTIIKQTANGQRVATLGGGSKLQGVTMTGGRLTEKWEHGAGVMVEDGTVSWCCISNNTSNARNVHGAGVSFWKGVIDHSVVAFNQSGTYSSSGGGIGGHYDSGKSSRYGAILVDTCLVYGNTVEAQNSSGTGPGGQGGGIGFLYSFPEVTIRNTTISGNSANLEGGGLYFDTSHMTLVNCIVSGNSVGSAEHNIVGTLASGSSNNLIGGDPAFLNPENGDYTLSYSSPAIGAGVAYEEMGVDMNNVAFAEPPSIGCYEYSARAAMPTFNPASGSIFYPTTSVTLSCETSDATIYYTTDGSTPTDSSAPYTAPIVLSATTTIKARAYATGKGPSAIVSATYTYKRPTPQPKEFSKSIEITLKSSIASNEITTGVPALVRLKEESNGGIVGFDYDDFKLTNGGDMMFVDASGKPLPHEVDTWNTAGESLVWVKLPSTAANTKIIMYYGKGAVSSENAADVWSDYVGVWHLSENGGANTDVTVHDSTEHGYTGTAKGIATSGSVSGKIGSGWRISDSSSATDKIGGILMDSMTSVTLGSEFTVSAWMWHKKLAYYYDHVFYRRDASNDSTAGWWSEISGAAGNNIKVNGGANGGKQFLIANATEVWIHLSLVYSGETGYSVVNGVQTATQTIAEASDNQKPIAFGTDSDNNDVSWKGIFDELRIRKGPYDANYLAAEYAAMNVGETDIFTYGDAKSTKARSGVIIIVE